MPDGIVEELFIAPPIEGGNPEVWFRNWSVCANLGLRLAGTLAEDPESVAWGQTKDKFVVRTGTTAATQKYYLFHIPRTSSIFGAGVIPTIIHDRTVTPYTSTLTLLDWSATVSNTQGLPAGHPQGAGYVNRLYTRADLPTATPVLSLGGGPFRQQVVDAGTITGTVTLADILSNADAPTYGLDDSGALVLLVVGPIGTLTGTGTKSTYVATGACQTLALGQTDIAVTLTAPKRSAESHLWIVRLAAGGIETVLFRSTPLNVSTSQTNFATGTITVSTDDRVLETPRPPPLNDICGSTVGGSSPFDASLTIDLGTFEVGFSALDDSFWDSSLPFITEEDYTPTSADTGLGTATFTTRVGFFFGTDWEYKRTGTTRTWTLDDPWDYIVQAAYPLQLTAPINVLAVISRETASSTQTGLFLKTDVGWKTIRDFTENPAGFVTLKVLTANERHALWYVEATTSTVYLTDLRNNRTRAVGTNLTQIRNYYFRLIAGDLASPMDVLWQGAEPAGQFLDGWETDGTPTLTDTGEGFPLSPLDDYARLVALPNGVAAPVLPSG